MVVKKEAHMLVMFALMLLSGCSAFGYDAYFANRPQVQKQHHRHNPFDDKRMVTPRQHMQSQHRSHRKIHIKNKKTGKKICVTEQQYIALVAEQQRREYEQQQRLLQEYYFKQTQERLQREDQERECRYAAERHEQELLKKKQQETYEKRICNVVNEQKGAVQEYFNAAYCDDSAIEGRYFDREYSFEKTCKDQSFVARNYTLSDCARTFLRDSQIDAHVFDHCDGLLIQQQLHEEVIEIIEDAAQLYEQYGGEMRNMTQSIADCAQVVSMYNREGRFREAYTLSDFCFTALDFAAAVAEGVFEGACNTAQAFVHPIDTLSNIAHGIGMLGYMVGAVTWQVCDIAATCVVDPALGKQKLQGVSEQLIFFERAIEQKLKETPVRELVKGGAAMATELFLTGKCLKAVHMVSKVAANKAVELLARVEQGLAPELVAMTSEGVAVQASKEGAALAEAVDELSQLKSHVTVADVEKVGVRWGFWNNLQKLTVDGREYANIGGRLYTRHAVDRMTPKGFGVAVGGSYGRGIPTMVVEDVIANGIVMEQRVVDGVERICKTLNGIGVVLENNIVITVLNV